MNLTDLMNLWEIDFVHSSEFRFLVYLNVTKDLVVSIGVGEDYYCEPRVKLQNINGYERVEARFQYANGVDFHASIEIPDSNPLKESYLNLFETDVGDIVTYASIEELHSLMITLRDSNNG